MLLLKVLTNRKAIQSALGLIETIQESSKDGKLNQKERNELTRVFWRLVDDVRGVVKIDKPKA
jgi:ribosomal protein S2